MPDRAPEADVKELRAPASKPLLGKSRGFAIAQRRPLILKAARKSDAVGDTAARQEIAMIEAAAPGMV